MLRYRRVQQAFVTSTGTILAFRILTYQGARNRDRKKQRKKCGLYWSIASCSVGNAHCLDTNFVILLKFVKDVPFHLFKND